MPSSFVAPWLDINPLSFLQAAEAGARIGQGQADLAERSKEAAGQLGLGYARLGTESQQAAASQKDAQARLALEQNRLTQMGNLGQQRLGLSEDRLAETENQHGAANDLTQQRIDQAGDLGQQRVDLGKQNQATRQEAVDNLAKKYGLSKDPAVNEDVLGFYTDPLSKSNPQEALKKYPRAVEHPGFNQIWKDFNPNVPGTKATFMGPRGSTWTVPVSDADAAAALGTNAPASLRGATAQPSTAPKYSTADSVKADYSAGKLTKEQAAKILRDNFGMQ
jgi:hypothetical protein